MACSLKAEQTSAHREMLASVAVVQTPAKRALDEDARLLLLQQQGAAMSKRDKATAKYKAKLAAAEAKAAAAKRKEAAEEKRKAAAFAQEHSKLKAMLTGRRKQKLDKMLREIAVAKKVKASYEVAAC